MSDGDCDRMDDQASVVSEILAERRRQIHAEGWSEEHDDVHTDGSLAMAAACYAAPKRIYTYSESGYLFDKDGKEDAWPTSWHPDWDKRLKHPIRRRLVIAAALLVAEIERIDRLLADPATHGQTP